LDVVISEDRNGVFNTYVDTKNPQIKVSAINTRVLRYQKSFWESIGFLIGAEGTTRNTSLKLGAGINNWFLHGTVGYDYKNLSIDKSNVFYGIGIIKLF